MTRTPRPRAAALRRLTAAAGAVALLTAMTAAGAGPSAAAARPLSTCTATTGVIVAVDFGHWGGPVLRSCGTTPTTGYALLNQGGWHTTGTGHDGPGFICRIGYSGYRHGTQYPAPSQQACVQTPPAAAYWASWQAGPGQASWTYSQAGAMSYHPQPGSVTMWVFGGTNLSGTAGSARPAVSPATLRALRVNGAVKAGTPAIINAAPATPSAHVSHSSPAPTIIAVVIVALLAAGGIAAVRRRRRELS
jgi:MYXO-CTERM domain-containing protein